MCTNFLQLKKTHKIWYIQRNDGNINMDSTKQGGVVKDCPSQILSQLDRNVSQYSCLSIKCGTCTMYFFLPKMVLILKSVVYKILMKIVQIVNKVPPVNSEVLVDLKNIESPEYYNIHSSPPLIRPLLQ